MAKISASDRDFLSKVSGAAFANPYSDTRWQLDAELTKLPADAEDIVERLIHRVSETLDRCPLVSELHGEDAEHVRYAAYFEAFHLSADDFDDLIRRQAKTDKALPFPKHASLVRLLAKRGIPTGEHASALTLFYQLRRAYFFLSDYLVGESAPMRQFKERLWSQLFGHNTLRFYRHLEGRMQDFSVLLVGDTGTGKSAAAAALGRSGLIPWTGAGFAESFAQLFVPLNLSELPGPLLESALFGHIKGAFTGAVSSRPGALSRSSAHGVVFLDEIGEVDVPAQIKLLRVLQERVFTPLGANAEERFEGRVIAATHQPIDELRRSSRLRNDFYYRLCSDVVSVPPLRDRLRADGGEMERLAQSILERTVGDGASSLIDEVLSVIGRDIPAGYEWPGNVREVQQCIRRVLLTGRCAVDPIYEGESPDFWTGAQRLDLDLDTLTREYTNAVYQQEKSYEGAARLLGIDRRTVKKHVDSIPDQKGKA